MSTETFEKHGSEIFLWNETCNPSDYVEAEYYLETAADPMHAAIAIAKEQSATTSEIPGIIGKHDLQPFSARVISAEIIGETSNQLLPPYWLKTPVYTLAHAKPSGFWKIRARIAYPIADFGYSLTHLWNAAGGEIHRLGFLNAVRLTDIVFPSEYLSHFSGPRYGIIGIRQKLGITDRPLFCRSMRPAVGMNTSQMLEINRQVLMGGFDMVKDDELTADTRISVFKERVIRMMKMLREVEDKTGEKKYYIANIIDDISKSFELADIAAQAGVNGVLLAPAIQGINIAKEIARRTDLAILSHITWQDCLSRHPKFGISDACFFKLQRICGADMLILPGNFATEMADDRESSENLKACIGTLGSITASLPVIAGGKTPEQLQHYVRCIGNTDFMIIAASAVDRHPKGPEAGARVFRDAWETA